MAEDTNKHIFSNLPKFLVKTTEGDVSCEDPGCFILDVNSGKLYISHDQGDSGVTLVEIGTPKSSEFVDLRD